MGGSAERDQDTPQVQVSTDLSRVLHSLTAVSECINVYVSPALTVIHDLTTLVTVKESENLSEKQLTQKPKQTTSSREILH